MQVGTGALYEVTLNIDIEAMNAPAGVTMYFEKRAHALRLDAGLGSKEGIAWGFYTDNIASSGWSELRVFGSSLNTVTNDVKMYSAGYVEGLLTCVRISQYYANVHSLLMAAEASHHALLQIRSQLEAQVGFMKANINLVEHIWPEEPTDIKWKHGRYLLFQLWGMMDGYNVAARHFKVHELSLVDFFLLNSMGEMTTLMEAYEPQKVSDRAKASSPPLVFLQKNAVVRREGGGANDTAAAAEEDAKWEQRMRKSRCSALVRVKENNADLYVGHTTWADYSTMTRIYKYYHLPLPGAESMVTMLAMSSYPGTIHSGDTYIMADSGLVITETQLELIDFFKYDNVKDFPFNAHLPNWVHLLITTRLASTGAEWAKIWSTQNTGTLMSQWLVVDYNLYSAGKPLPDNLLWIVEQVPGQIESRDMTQYLRSNGYWGSVNRPFFQSVRDVSGFTKAQASHGALYSVNDCPRCRIFKGAAPGINSLLDMRGTMQRNGYPFQAHEPMLPGHDIAARFDLDPTMPLPNGGIDSKITSRCLQGALTSQIISGPTHQGQAVFSWKQSDGRLKFPGVPWRGLPERWGFDWLQTGPVGEGGLVDLDVC